VLEDQIAVREKAVAIAEKNAAAIHAVNTNVKQAQAKSMRLNMGRRQHVVLEDPSLSSDIRNLLKHEEEEPCDSNDRVLPPLDASTRPSVVAEKADDSKRKLSVSVPFTGSPSPAVHSQSHLSQKVPQLFNSESAQNIVSAVIQLGFTLQDQETFTAVLVEKVQFVVVILSSFWSPIHDHAGVFLPPFQ
jgi:hypothetical protein